MGEHVSLARIRKDTAKLSPLPEGMTQAKADIDGLLVALTILREMRQSHQRLLEAPHRLPTGLARFESRDDKGMEQALPRTRQTP